MLRSVTGDKRGYKKASGTAGDESLEIMIGPGEHWLVEEILIKLGSGVVQINIVSSQGGKQYEDKGNERTFV
jgi:hypothetical protein